jgi:hypothetical protein
MERDEKDVPFYARGCYAVPIRYLYGTAAEINFWDVVYFFAHEGGGSFETCTQELVEQMGLSRQMVGRLRQQAVERGELLQDVSWASGHRFVLRVPGFECLKKGVIWKPLGYVRNGWQRAVTPAIPKRVLNLYLQQPRQQTYHLEPQYIAARCRRRFLCGQQRTVAPLNLADVGKALRLLVRLGLLLPEREGFRLDWGTFSRPAPLDGPAFDAPDPRQQPAFRQAAATDSQRAARALELLDVGNYDVERHLAAILHDLAYVRDEDYGLLKSKVHRRRNRPPGPQRWRETWRAFQYELKRRVAELRAPKRVLELGEGTSFVCPLTLDVNQVAGHILAVRLVSRVEWPWYLSSGSAGPGLDGAQDGTPCAPAVRLELRAGDRLIFARTIGPGEAEVRHSLHPDDWPGLGGPIELAARCERALPGVRAEAWLEARIRR